uniref:Uncharacterized protein n=1 Tax=Rhizophagus irregularis (strain DAOM 181602 / DAOM 197198 / MUCL 43194) TaxID=747089 RepID=U9TLZ5_RHIID
MEFEKEYEIEKQFKEAEEYRRSKPIAFGESTHPQAIYKSRLLNPFTKNIPKFDNNTVILQSYIIL